MIIKFDTSPVSLTQLPLTHKAPQSSHRLIVLVPGNMDFNAATQQIGRLAHATNMHVQLLGLCRDETEKAGMRRELITMASLLQNNGTCAEVSVETGANWMEVLKSIYELGDLIVCFAEQQTGLLRRPLSEILESSFEATVYVLPGSAAKPTRSNRFLQISTWLGFMAVIGGFGLLQTKIVQLSTGGAQNVLLILSLIPELWLICVWDGQHK